MDIIDFNITQDWRHGITIIFICCVLVVVAALIDMWTGIDAARANKEKICSHSLRKTVRKIIDYLRIVLFAVLIDVLGLCFPWYELPYACIVCTLGVLLIEGKSVIENFRKKRSHAADIIDMVAKIIDCADENDAKKLISLIKSNKTNNPERISGSIRSQTKSPAE
ncbi:MAG: phage holin family protein [Candidatus Cryptobacteroides sp.]